MGFDFAGTYTTVVPKERIDYEMADGRVVSVVFAVEENGVRVTETFDADSGATPEQQQQGWQSILDNFARHVEKG